jgi:hypothetical protein
MGGTGARGRAVVVIVIVIVIVIFIASTDPVPYRDGLVPSTRPLPGALPEVATFNNLGV